ncbi:NRDE family protein [Salipaludibacillus aurantiacus]|uniref:Uncharacterized conserved protein, contains NRDE domain n=1 Tax=Salipaludibacillus aurantiacus TaxID=1601833 RepID=A0A1H9P237_9BACI|nr:NRDE family protein [Salipaludibacillus aurantiacus]SER42296.1 Uncharacterized conserved protein, contains NRDE domain [Salipaludibacillus aurantiacus]
MCIIGTALNVHPDYPFIMAANRDEFYNRRTKEAHFWPEDPSVLGGKDLERGGSWLGISSSGDLAALTNVRRPSSDSDALRSRGELISSYFNKRNTFKQNLNMRDKYGGFNLLYGNLNKLTFITNQSGDKKVLTRGIHVLSNASLNSPWPKSLMLKKGIEKSTAYTGSRLVEYLLQLLSFNEPFADKELPDTGVGIALERKLSPVFIQTENYGTRSSTVILADRSGNITFTEKSYVPEFLSITYHFPVRKT